MSPLWPLPSSSSSAVRVAHTFSLALSRGFLELPAAASKISFSFQEGLLKREGMEHLFKGLNEHAPDCSFHEKAIQRCPFLRNINKPTCFSFSFLDPPQPGAKGPIFEDGPNFDMAFKLFHGKNGVVPLTESPNIPNIELVTEPIPQFNPLAAKAATISLSAFGPGGPFSFGPFFDRSRKQKKPVDSSDKKGPSSEKGNPTNHEAHGNEWLQTGNCPIAKSYRAVSSVLPLVAKALQPPPGIKLKCPPAVVTARAALARTALVKTLRPQPLPSKMLVIALLGMAANVPLGAWKEHTEKFSLSWFAAVHAAVPFIAMLRKSVVMPKSAMALTIMASIVGQVIGSRAERIRMKAAAQRAVAPNLIIDGITHRGTSQADVSSINCSTQGMMTNSPPVKPCGTASASSFCC